MQIPDQVEYLVLFCKSVVNTGLFVILTWWYIQIHKYKKTKIYPIFTKQYIYKTKYAQLHSSRIFVNVYIIIGGTKAI